MAPHHGRVAGPGLEGDTPGDITERTQRQDLNKCILLVIPVVVAYYVETAGHYQCSSNTHNVSAGQRPGRTHAGGSQFAAMTN